MFMTILPAAISRGFAVEAGRRDDER